jgi:DMSO/TMAO reductase YedYZ heme-binding membrane subunit
MTMTPGSVHAMLSGMAIMVLPALLICIGIAVMAYRRRDKFASRGTARRAPPRRV